GPLPMNASQEKAPPRPHFVRHNRNFAYMKHFRSKPNNDGKQKWGATLTSPELITERFKQGFDPQYRHSLYQQMRYVFGESWRKDQYGGAMEGGDFPDYADIRVKYQEIGRSRRIYS